MFVAACDFNEQLGLLAIALIDREIKIYFIKQNGTNIGLVEHFSFKVKYYDVSCLHLEKYVMNGKPILCCGTQTGEILVYYIDWDDKDPNYGMNCKKKNI